ncbi:nucleotide sugar dehydrogenase [Gammaproteobacteria bacterium]|nr:nucleotide sugar dehydrogenase [Gammaproteobacteria bacterium]
MKITIAGIGYVGASLAVLLAQNNEVVAYDIDLERINLINSKKSPIFDADIQDFLDNKKLNLIATHEKEKAFRESTYVIVATPTNYDAELNHFDTSSIELVIQDVFSINPDAIVVIKSTVPLGYVERIKNDLGVDRIFFSPEFLREGLALYDNLYPSRIVVGERSERAQTFANLLLEGAIKKDVPILLTDSSEGEAIKLFANSYLAMRVAYFNELDMYAETHDLNSRQMIEGISLDPRIGNYYNNPSFGYGGFCLPKDTKQLLANYDQIPQNLIAAIVDSNNTRMDFIVEQILKRNPKKVGIYRLIMKAGSDNFRSSAMLGLIDRFQNKGIELIIFEPKIVQQNFNGIPVASSFDTFVLSSDIIVANRIDDDLMPHQSKVYSRDLFKLD